jgi:glycosyltransferase involved in cell wall biosynthesis
LFLTHWYPTPEMPVNGNFIREHARAVALFQPVTVIHIQGVDANLRQNYAFERCVEGNLTEIHLKYRKGPLPRLTWLRRLRGVDHIFRGLMGTNCRPDVIHANVFSSADLAAYLSFRYKIPAVLTEHATSYPRRLFGPFQAFKIRFYNNRLARIMPVSEDLARHMQAYGITTRMQVVPNVVDTSQFHPPVLEKHRDRPIAQILVVARLDPIKGLEDLLAALARLAGRGIKFTAGLVGDGPERQSLQMLAKQLNLEDRLTFYGVKSRGEIAEMLRQVDLFALTSYWENQPVVLLEALASGLPVVAARVGGIPEFVKPERGVLIEPGNVQSIADGLMAVMDHLDDYDSQAIARFARENFSYEVVGRQFSQVYAEVIQEYPR